MDRCMCMSVHYGVCVCTVSYDYKSTLLGHTECQCIIKLKSITTKIILFILFII